MSVVEQHGRAEVLQWAPTAIVMLQGANDAARDTTAAFEARLRSFLGWLRAAVEEGRVPLRRLVWVTSPTRHYKVGNRPGEATCAAGQAPAGGLGGLGGQGGQGCEMGSTGWRHEGGEIEWESHPASKARERRADATLLDGTRCPRHAPPPPHCLAPHPPQVPLFWGTLDRRRLR